MVRRVAIIFREKCHPNECGNYLCAKLCPVNRTGTECITKNEEDNKAKIDEVTCTGCGICPKRCPFGAIKIVNLPDKLTKDPIHRYGENMFELFSLPSPVFNKVVGIVGPNAMGKSTAIKILAGILHPNLGQLDKETAYEDIIKYFHGSETQAFFEKLKSGDIVVSYKPQHIELIPKSFNGTVEHLLKKVDQTNKFDEVVRLLNLEKFLDRNIKDVSGGELQRIAIAATFLKEGNVYVFDEPSSFLDIKQRIKVSEFIRGLPNPEKAVLVIEHDLIILDYMTDSVHVMYGSEGAYGVVSGLKSTREGINQFLFGFLREENMRFRNNKLTFGKGQAIEQVDATTIVSWSDLSKKLGPFTLSTGKGEIKRKDIIGILGENGIGKTSFVKLLAGVIESDKGKISSEITVSYKPQYLEIHNDPLVAEYIEYGIQHYYNQLIGPLNIEPLYTKKLSELSGGELQRVSIAHALAQEAQLFLLDEPSAYLDIEQRLAISKIIRNIAMNRGVAILVVDHDLVFIDNIADKLIVFEGEPAVSGRVEGPFSMEEGMNKFLDGLQITMRRDHDSHRPRINKPGSVKDREQQRDKKYYYV